MIRDYTCDERALKLFHDGMKVLSKIESNGIRINEEYLIQQIAAVEQSIVINEKELKQDPIWKRWKRRFGESANLGSKDQLAAIIFRELKYENRKGYTATRKLASDEAAYAHLVNSVPFIAKFFKNEKLKKVAGTYLTGIRKEVMNGYLHPNFNLHKIITYRSSSDGPNFQNFPKRNKLVAEIARKCMIPRPGHRIAEIDISGAEVRVSACYNRDPKLLTYIKDPTTDMHQDTACDMFFLKPNQVDKKGPRDCCKNMFVFPQFYGSVWFQCAPNIWEAMMARKFVIKDTDKLVVDHLAKRGITELGTCKPGEDPEPGTFASHVKDVENIMWNKRFSIYSKWKRDYWQQYLNTGGFKTLTGFTCWGEFSRNDVLNYPIQGSSFHCLLWSLIELQNWIDKYNMKSKLIGQIHDSIVADIHPKETDDFLNAVKYIMTEKLQKTWEWIIVPIKIEVELSEVDGNWFELKEVPV